jgi:hypothetical protein
MNSTRYSLLLALLAPLALASTACDKKADPAPGAQPAASAAPAASPVASAAASGAASAAGSAAARPASDGAAETWKGAFKAKPSSIELSKDAAADVKVWAKDPGTELVGDGTLTLQITGSGNRRAVKGEGSGALGDLVIVGEISDNELRARVDAKNPNDPNAVTGVLQGTVKGDAIESTLRVSNRNANRVREADFKLTK